MVIVEHFSEALATLNANTGDEIPRAPRWSGGLVAAYEADLARGWRLTLDGSVDNESSQTHQQNPRSVPKSDSITMYGAGVGVISDNGLSVRLVGCNLTDENRYTFVSDAVPAGGQRECAIRAAADHCFASVLRVLKARHHCESLLS